MRPMAEKPQSEILDELTPKQRAYVEARLNGMSPPDAATAADIAGGYRNAWNYENHPKVKPIIQAANQYAVDRYNVTRDDVVSGLMDAVTAAGSSTELTQAWREIGKLLGHYESEKIEIHHSVENMTLNKLETLSEKELLQLAEMPEFQLEHDHDLVANYQVLPVEDDESSVS
jgi:hypothetical protein